MRTPNLKMAHTAYIGYGVGYLEHRYLENWANDFFKLAQFQGPDQS